MCKSEARHGIHENQKTNIVKRIFDNVAFEYDRNIFPIGIENKEYVNKDKHRNIIS